MDDGRSNTPRSKTTAHWTIASNWVYRRPWRDNARCPAHSIHSRASILSSGTAASPRCVPLAARRGRNHNHTKQCPVLARRRRSEAGRPLSSSRCAGHFIAGKRFGGARESSWRSSTMCRATRPTYNSAPKYRAARQARATEGRDHLRKGTHDAHASGPAAASKPLWLSTGLVTWHTRGLGPRVRAGI